MSAQTASVDNPGGVAPVGELFASDPAGLTTIQPAGSGMNVPPGSQLSAGVAAATLRLARGGQVRICPRSSLNINRGGQGLMLGLGSGSIEIDYRLNQSVADVLVTPDFNIRLVGPAVYHFALGVNNKGDTCFKPMRGNASGVVFSELLGEDSYGVMADEKALFAAGKLAGRSSLDSECGCPAPPALQADTSDPGTSPTSARPPLVPTPDVTAPLPPGRPGETHVEVETPFVFSANDPARPNTAAKLNFSTLPNVFFVQEEDEPAILVEKPAEVSIKSKAPEPVPKTGTSSSNEESKKEEKKSFLARVKGFFGSIFHR
jgi:hypothetical protein